MKRPESARPKTARVIWDEPNLEANEKIKEQFSNVKIDEPKTPYRGPLADGDMDADDMDPLASFTLEPEPSATGSLFDGLVGGVMRSGGSATSGHGGGGGGQAMSVGGHSSSLSPRDNAAEAADADGTAAGAEGPSHVEAGMDVDDDGHAAATRQALRSEWSTDGSTLGLDTSPDGAAAGAEKVAAFAQNRKVHYNMAEALKQAREMMSHDEEEEEEDGGQQGGTKPANAATNGGATAAQAPSA